MSDGLGKILLTTLIGVLLSFGLHDCVSKAFEKNQSPWPGRGSRISPPSLGPKPKFDYKIPGVFLLRRQSKAFGCWAASACMLWNWKKQTDLNPESVLENIAPSWARIYADADVRGLSRAEKNRFLNEAGLVYEAGASYSVEGLLDLLKTFGPLWFTVDSDGFNTHAVVVTGLFGSGDMSDTFVDYADPGDGKAHRVLYAQFMKRYEDIAYRENKGAETTAGYTFSIQVVHFPKASP